MKNFKKKVAIKIVKVLSVVSMGVIVMSSRVFASGTVLTSQADILKPLDNLKQLVLGIIAAIGIIVIAKNVMEFSQALKAEDDTSMNRAIKGMVGGFMMAAISGVLAFLGFTA